MNHHPAVDLLPALPKAELDELARDIATSGLLNPIAIWTDPRGEVFLLDGRNRLAACKIAGVEPRFEPYVGNDPVGFVIAQNVTRRHLSESQRAMVAAELANQRLGTNQYKPMGSSGELPTTQAQAAALVGVSVPSVKRAVTVLRDGTPELVADVRAGKTTVTGAERIVRQAEKVTAEVFSAAVDIEQGDYLASQLAPGSVDAVITTVPHTKRYLSVLNDLADWADLMLATTGVLAVMVTTENLPEVFMRLAGYRAYRSVIPVLAGKKHASPAWKPVVLYGGSKRLYDGAIAGGSELEGFTVLVERLTLPGQLVVDPLLGDGTALLAAHIKGRHAFGRGVSANAVAAVRRRFVGPVTVRRTA